jgi:hypothetical protein
VDDTKDFDAFLMLHKEDEVVAIKATAYLQIFETFGKWINARVSADGESPALQCGSKTAGGQYAVAADVSGNVGDVADGCPGQNRLHARRAASISSSMA